jgi:hypothetical protein
VGILKIFDLSQKFFNQAPVHVVMGYVFLEIFGFSYFYGLLKIVILPFWIELNLNWIPTLVMRGFFLSLYTAFSPKKSKV